jgi:hypothetical protein
MQMTKTYYEDAGKGSTRRPDSVTQDKFRSNWDAIFGKKAVKEDGICKVCHGEGGAYDCGWFYECPVCNKK